MPQALPEHPEPEIDQVTAVLVDPVTVAVNCCSAPVETWTDAGETLTFTDCADSITTVPEADLLGLAVDLAVTVAIDGTGTDAGAV